jgi:hypothetical protein
VYSFQVLLPIVLVCVFTSSEYSHFPKPLHKVLSGVFWPEHWRRESCPVSAAGAAAGESESPYAEPIKMLKANRIISSDILNHLLILCTFGICSPFLALIMVVSVSLKHRMWVVLLGRFVHTRVTAAAAAAVAASGATSSQQLGEDCAMVALSAACVPLLDIVARCVWPVIWSSCVFFAFLSWDMLGDEVGWREAMWAPLVVMGLPVFLWMCLNIMRRCAGDVGGRDGPAAASSPSLFTSVRDGTRGGVASTSSPLHSIRAEERESERVTEMRGSSVDMMTTMKSNTI